MKKVKLNGKLSLKKETIAKLNNEQMNALKGGWSHVGSGCYTCNPSDLTCYGSCGCPETGNHVSVLQMDNFSISIEFQ